jgi:hypothetical protein
MGHFWNGKRIWPTLLSAAAQAASRASCKVHDRAADSYAAVVLARTAFDAYLHELISLRRLDRYLKFAKGPGAKKRLSAGRWTMISNTRKSLAGLSKAEKKKYQDIHSLQLDVKLQTILLSLIDDHSATLISNFEVEFRNLIELNWLRNAIIHHEFGPPSTHLRSICLNIAKNLGIEAPDPKRPWEDLLMDPSVAAWACKTVSGALLALEALEKNRPIHLSTTRNLLESAVSPLHCE